MDFILYTATGTTCGWEADDAFAGSRWNRHNRLAHLLNAFEHSCGLARCRAADAVEPETRSHDELL
ncbi:hypothetical protein N802_16515 [Knoellia sinensis KCTC 19936]|uniref:Uncharacterized protein n=1 Tax=Knoellia sinensis KCTC 19936 TaxID=1385520 RepID=A0A0A0J6S9_9MICO|nr:hypothetical protein N802_16515 [Knoellia sinensis KCTC 19936]